MSETIENPTPDDAPHTTPEWIAKNKKWTLGAIIDKCRPDNYGRGFFDTKRKKYAYARTPIDLSNKAEVERVIAAHLSPAGPHAAVELMPIGDKTRLAVIDLDDHDEANPVGWEGMKKAALAIGTALRSRGMDTMPVRSGGGSGIHLHMWWSDWVSAAGVRKVVKDALAEVGFTEGKKGVFHHQVEIFPDERDVVTEDIPGANIALPFGRKSVPLGREMEPTDLPIMSADCRNPDFLEDDDDEPEDTGTASRGTQGAGTPGNLVFVKEALEHISPDDNKEWITIGYALRNVFGEGEDIKAIWCEWLQRKNPAKYDKRKPELRWSGLKLRTTNRRVGLPTIYNMAEKHSKGAWKRPAGASVASIMFSDDELARQFVDEHADDLRYTDATGVWNVWDGSRWRVDATQHVLDQAREFCRGAAKSAGRKAVQITSVRQAKSVLTFAASDQRIAMRVEDWDAHPWLLATPDGTVDLTTGELREADPRDYLTRCTSVAPDGDCPLWKQTIGEIFNGKSEMISFVQRWLGYGITGSVREEKFAFAWGVGRNGKGTLFETVGKIMGDLMTVVPMATLMAKKNPEHATEIAKLKGVRLALASEVSSGARWDTETIKRLTGGDKMTGRFMRQDFFDFEMTHKFIVSGNHQPALGRVDPAIAARIDMIPFEVSFVGREDKKLKTKLAAEMPGILKWLIDGCLEWQRIGLAPPAQVVEQTKEYLHNKDDLNMWIDEACVRENDPTGRVTNTHMLFASFKEWCVEQGAEAGTIQDFNARLAAAGFEIFERSHSVRRIRGLRLLGTKEAQDLDEERDRKAREAAAAMRTSQGASPGRAMPEPDYGAEGDIPF